MQCPTKAGLECCWPTCRAQMHWLDWSEEMRVVRANEQQGLSLSELMERQTSEVRLGLLKGLYRIGVRGPVKLGGGERLLDLELLPRLINR